MTQITDSDMDHAERLAEASFSEWAEANPQPCGDCGKSHTPAEPTADNVYFCRDCENKADAEDLVLRGSPMAMVTEDGEALDEITPSAQAGPFGDDEAMTITPEQVMAASQEDNRPVVAKTTRQKATYLVITWDRISNVAIRAKVVDSKGMRLAGESFARTQRSGGMTVIGGRKKGFWTSRTSSGTAIHTVFAIRFIGINQSQDATSAMERALAGGFSLSQVEAMFLSENPQQAVDMIEDLDDEPTMAEMADHDLVEESTADLTERAIREAGMTEDLGEAGPPADVVPFTTAQAATKAPGAPSAEEAEEALKARDTFKFLRTILPHTSRALLYGPTATGKTHLAIEVAESLGLDLYIVAMTDQTPMAELRGHYIPTAGGAFIFHEGAILRAFRSGGLLLIDEIDEAGADALAFISAALNDPKVAKITLPTGDTVQAHPDFRVIACMNGQPGDLHPRLASRFPATHLVQEPDPQAFKALPEDLRTVAKKLSKSTVPQDQRVDLRSWFEFAAMRDSLGHQELAARAIFGPGWSDLVAAIAAANDETAQSNTDKQAAEGV